MTPVEARLLLSDMEFAAARLKKQGYKSDDIAKQLHISADAARKYVLRAKKKLGNNYHNSPVFRGLGESSFNHLNNGDKKCGKEIVQQNIQNGYTRMAYSRYGQGHAYVNDESRLAYAINGLGDRKYLMRKRGEILKALAVPKGQRVLKLEAHMLTEAVTHVINHYQIKLLRTEQPGPVEGDVSVKHYLCKTEAEYVRLMGAIIGRPEIEYRAGSRAIKVSFSKPVYIEHFRILASGEGCRELISHDKQFQSSASFIIQTPGLQSGKTYLAEIQIGGGSQLEYLFTA